MRTSERTCTGPGEEGLPVIESGRWVEPGGWANSPCTALSWVPCFCVSVLGVSERKGFLVSTLSCLLGLSCASLVSSPTLILG